MKHFKFVRKNISEHWKHISVSRVSDIVSIVAHENDGPKVFRLWIALRDALGPKLIGSYKRLIELINKGIA